jgi:hypothetical protein
MSDWPITQAGGAVTFDVRVIPRSSRNEIVGIQDDVLKVKLTAPPVEGAANAALIHFFADRLGVRRSAVSIIAGQRNRKKTVRVEGMTEAQVKRALLGRSSA